MINNSKQLNQLDNASWDFKAFTLFVLALSIVNIQINGLVCVRIHPLPVSRWVASQALVRSVYRLPRFSASNNQDANQVPTPPHYPAPLLSDGVLHKGESLSDGD